MGIAKSIVEFLGPWWPFVAKVGLLWFVGQFMKVRVWTKSRASHSHIFKFMRDTMPLHAIVGGIAWGLAYPYMPASEIVTSRGGAINEGIVAGLFTVIGYMALEATAEYYVKKDPDSKWQIVLRVLRESVRARVTDPPQKG